MKPRVDALLIERFRALDHLQLEALGRVNLITGRNNTGKSSVLEALRIWASVGSPSVLDSILRSREEDVDEPAQFAQSPGQQGSFTLMGLFPGFRPLDDVSEAIQISATGSNRVQRLTLSIGRFAELTESDGTRRLVPYDFDSLLGADALLALIVEGDSGRKVIRLNYFSPRRPLRYPNEWAGDASVPCVFVSPYGPERATDLGALWDKIALSDREQYVVEALRIMSPDIDAVSMIGGSDSRRSRTAIARSTKFERPVPLRSFGDGLNRVFEIVLSLVNARSGLLLIDEVENGLHYTVQPDFWRAIFRLASRLDIQVFATSHSWDSVKSFQEAASEHPEEGVLIRLARKGENVIPTLFRENELAIATRDRIEVR